MRPKTKYSTLSSKHYVIISKYRQYRVRKLYIICIDSCWLKSANLNLTKLDFYSGGDMHYHLTQHGMFSEDEVRFYAAELALGLGHMHSKGIVYRDLKVCWNCVDGINITSVVLYCLFFYYSSSQQTFF